MEEKKRWKRNIFLGISNLSNFLPFSIVKNKNTKKVQEVTNGNKEEEKKNEDENVLEKIEHIEGSPEKEGDNYTIVMQTAKGTSK